MTWGLFSSTSFLNLLVFAIALAPRLAYFFEQSGKPWFGRPLLDSRVLVAQAREIARAFSFPDAPFFRPPFYTVFLAAFYRVFGDAAVVAIPLVQHLIGAGFCVLVFNITRQSWSRTAGLAAGILAAFCGPLIFYEGEILGDSLTLALSACFLSAWVRGNQTHRERDFAAAGGFAGLTAITRPNILPVFFVLSITCLLSAFRHEHDRKGRGTAVRRIGVGLATCVAFVAIPASWNMAHGDFHLVASQGAINFFIGNNPDANGLNVVLPRAIQVWSDDRDSVEEFSVLAYLQGRYGFAEGTKRYYQGEGQKLKPSVIGKYWRDRAIQFLTGKPGEAGRLYVRKLLALVNNYEVRNNRDFQFMCLHGSRALPWFPATFGVVFAAGIAGAWIGLRSHRPSVRWVVGYTVLYFLTVLLFFVAGRLRISAMAGLFVLAGIGVGGVIELIQMKRWNKLLVPGILVACAAVGSFYPWYRVDFRYSPDQPAGKGISSSSFFPGEFASLATAALEAGQIDAASDLARRAVELDPKFVYGWTLCGRAALAGNNAQQAIDNFARALELEPQSPVHYNDLGVIAERRGQWQDAVTWYRLALGQNPAYARALENLAVLAKRSQQADQARELARRAIASDPQAEYAHAILGKPLRHVSPRRAAAIQSELSASVESALDMNSTGTPTQLLTNLR